MKYKRSDKDLMKSQAETFPPEFSRRTFITSVSAASLGVLFGACGKDPASPEGEKEKNPDSTPTGPSVVAVESVNSYSRAVIKNKVQKVIEGIGGLGDIIKSGDKVAIKINLTGGVNPARKVVRDYGMSPGETFWTHPEVLRAVCELVIDAGAAKITVVESIYDQQSYADYGYKAIVESVDATFVDLNNPAPYSGFVTQSVGKNYNIYKSFPHNPVLHEIDAFISLAKAKRHWGAGVTHSMKNLVGTIPAAQFSVNGSSHRAAIHEHPRGNRDLVRVVLDLNHARPIHLAVTDAIKTAANGEGPWIDGFGLTAYDTILASKDPVAADSIATKVMGLDPMAADGEGPWGGSMPATDNYLKLAQEQGLGVCDPGNITVVGTLPSSQS